MNPLTDVTVIADVPPPPWVKDTVRGTALRTKSGVTAMVNVNDWEWVRLPLVPVIVIGEDPAGVPGSTLTVAVEVTVPPAVGVTGFGENTMCTPEGSAPSLRLTAELKEPSDVTVTVSPEDPPAPTLIDGGLRESEKSAPEVIERVNVVE